MIGERRSEVKMRPTGRVDLGKSPDDDVDDDDVAKVCQHADLFIRNHFLLDWKKITHFPIDRRKKRIDVK
jgi:hypothetical protein